MSFDSGSQLVSGFVSTRFGVTPRVGPAVDGSRRVDYETEGYFGFRWWHVRNVVRSEERFCPGRMPELLIAFLAGERIAEPFESWP